MIYLFEGLLVVLGITHLAWMHTMWQWQRRQDQEILKLYDHLLELIKTLEMAEKGECEILEKYS